MEATFLNNTTNNTQSVVVEKRIYTIPEIQEILGIGRNATYNLIKTGCFKTVRIGNNIRISKKSFDEWLDSAN